MLPSSASSASRSYQPALMGFRAVAIGLVVAGHWLLLPMEARLPLFVLSGYLISGIIWKNAIYWDGRPGWARRLGVFYTRRFLRIIPPYYFSLALGALLPLATLRQYPGWFVLPLANVLCYQLRAWPEGVGHYWTLAVEEQFYVVWPLLLGLVRQRAGALWALVALGVGYRLYGVFYLVPDQPQFAPVLLPGCFDLFALGALLRLHTLPAGGARAYPGWPAVLAGAAWALLRAITHASPTTERLWEALSPALGGAGSYFLLRWLLGAPPGGRWLAHPWLQWLGQRSYGIYLYHLLLPVLYQRVVFRLFPEGAASWRPWLMQPAVMALLLLPVLIGLSACSWRWLESPLNKLKTRFPYQPASPVA